MSRKIAGALMTAAALAGVGYLAFARTRVRRFRLREREVPSRFPSIAVLKPLYGEDEELEKNLRSFCEQDYPSFEVIFGVHDARDPASEVARRVVAAFPHRARLVIGEGTTAGGNPKVANLTRVAHGVLQEIVVLADADMRVSPDYLRTLTAPFDDARVGAVTCLYAGRSAPNIVSHLAAMYVNEQFAPSVLVANAMEPLRYAFGATIAVRRSVLERIGGFPALAGHVADDHLLGRLVTELGLDVHLSRYVVENVMHERDFAGMWSRELRWSRTIRSVRPLGHAFSVVTFGLPIALLAAFVAPGRASSALLATATILRLLLQTETNAAFGVHSKAASALLVPVRDFLSLSVWAAAFFDRGVLWRGQQLQLDAEGHIIHH
ncbi:MAG: bacteriohopanetetrol glucosamine biosynthesis glycosyltransferase HpnI [Vulcanimicrobiaceae bacterium]